MTTKKQAPFQCEHCDHAPYPTKNGLSTHLRYAHGIAGTAKSTLAARAAKAAASKRGSNVQAAIDKGIAEAAAAAAAGQPHPFQCPHCPFIAKWIGGFKNHMRSHAEKETQIVKRTKETVTLNAPKQGRTNGTAPDPRRSLIPEATLALALGRFQELSTRIAIEHDLPPRTFAASLAELIYAATLR